MDDIIRAVDEQQRELLALLDGLDDAGWSTPTPQCPGWTVADVVLHLAQTNEMAIASADDRLAEAAAELTEGLEPVTDVDEGVEQMVRRERGGPNDALLGRFRTSASTFLDRLRTGDPHARVTWVAGQLSLRTLGATRLSETWIHTGDVADALGRQLVPADRLRHVARLAWRTLPYAFSRAGRELSGPVAFHLSGPDGDPWTFVPDDDPVTVVTGDGHELCLVAGRRREPEETSLRAEGADADAVLQLVRTYA